MPGVAHCPLRRRTAYACQRHEMTPSAQRVTQCRPYGWEWARHLDAQMAWQSPPPTSQRWSCRKQAIQCPASGLPLGRPVVKLALLRTPFCDSFVMNCSEQLRVVLRTEYVSSGCNLLRRVIFGNYVSSSCSRYAGSSSRRQERAKPQPATS